MELSLIITTYNEPDKLAKVLQAIKIQTVKPAEIIIADDGSDNKTAETIRKFRKKIDIPMKHVWQPDHGFRAAKIRNKAISISKGEYIVLLDGDSIPNRFFIEDHIKLAEKGFFVQGKRVLVGKKASKFFNYKTANSYKELIKLVVKGELSNIHHLLRLPFLPAFKNKKLRGIKANNQGFFKEDLLAVNGFNEKFNCWGLEDTELAIRLFRYGIKRKEHPFMAICFHLWHPKTSTLIHKDNKKLLNKTIKEKNYWCFYGIKKDI